MATGQIETALDEFNPEAYVLAHRTGREMREVNLGRRRAIKWGGGLVTLLAAGGAAAVWRALEAEARREEIEQGHKDAGRSIMLPHNKLLNLPLGLRDNITPQGGIPAITTSDCTVHYLPEQIDVEDASTGQKQERTGDLYLVQVRDTDRRGSGYWPKFVASDDTGYSFADELDDNNVLRANHNLQVTDPRVAKFIHERLGPLASSGNGGHQENGPGKWFSNVVVPRLQSDALGRTEIAEVENGVRMQRLPGGVLIDDVLASPARVYLPKGRGPMFASTESGTLKVDSHRHLRAAVDHAEVLRLLQELPSLGYRDGTPQWALSTSSQAEDDLAFNDAVLGRKISLIHSFVLPTQKRGYVFLHTRLPLSDIRRVVGRDDVEGRGNCAHILRFSDDGVENQAGILGDATISHAGYHVYIGATLNGHRYQSLPDRERPGMMKELRRFLESAPMMTYNDPSCQPLRYYNGERSRGEIDGEYYARGFLLNLKELHVLAGLDWAEKYMDELRESIKQNKRNYAFPG